MTINVQHVVQVWREGDTYVARAVPLDVMSCGETPAEARTHLTEAVALFLKTASAQGTLVEVLEESGYALRGERWLAPELLLSETVTQAVHA